MSKNTFVLRYIVVEDEPLARRGLVKLLEGYDFLECLGMYSNAEDARVMIECHTIDLVFLDIHLPEESGIELAWDLPRNTQIIFTTAYSDYALESYESNTVDYLLKPISEERLRKAIDKLVYYRQGQVSEDESQENKDHIFVKADRKWVRLKVSDIQYIEAMKDYVVIYAADKRLIVAMNIKTILKQLPNIDFVRVNKSFVVNLNHVESVDSQWVTVSGVELPLGSSFKEGFLKRIQSQTLSR